MPKVIRLYTERISGHSFTSVGKYYTLTVYQMHVCLLRLQQKNMPQDSAPLWSYISNMYAFTPASQIVFSWGVSCVTHKNRRKGGVMSHSINTAICWQSVKEKLSLIGFRTEFKQQKIGGSGVNDLFIITCSACHVSFCTSSSYIVLLTTLLYHHVRIM